MDYDEYTLSRSPDAVNRIARLARETAASRTRAGMMPTAVLATKKVGRVVAVPRRFMGITVGSTQRRVVLAKPTLLGWVLVSRQVLWGEDGPYHVSWDWHDSALLGADGLLYFKRVETDDGGHTTIRRLRKADFETWDVCDLKERHSSKATYEKPYGGAIDEALRRLLNEDGRAYRRDLAAREQAQREAEARQAVLFAAHRKKLRKKAILDVLFNVIAGFVMGCFFGALAGMALGVVLAGTIASFSPFLRCVFWRAGGRHRVRHMGTMV
jgi:hypothetical protein